MMAFVDVLHTVISLADATVLIVWSALDLRKYRRERGDPSSHGYRRDGCFLITIGLFALIAYFIGQYTEGQLKAEIATANARASQAEQRAATANAEAAQANERAQALERDNLILRGDVNKAAGEVAILQKDAADARAAQQRVETELAQQQERAAKAEKALLELQERQRPRTLTAQQRFDFTATLKGSQPGEKIQLGGAVGIEEACNFAYEFLTLFKDNTSDIF